MRHLTIALALLMLSMSVSSTPAQAKTCLKEISALLEDDYHVILMAEGPINHIQFSGMDNMLVELPGEKTTRIHDFDWKLPTNTKEVSFSARHYNLSKDMQVVLVIFDECQQGFLLPLVAWATVIIDPYPYPPYNTPRARTLTPIKAPAQLPHR